jgi:hypothetical protein
MCHCPVVSTLMVSYDTRVVAMRLTIVPTPAQHSYDLEKITMAKNDLKVIWRSLYGLNMRETINLTPALNCHDLKKMTWRLYEGRLNMHHTINLTLVQKNCNDLERKNALKVIWRSLYGQTINLTPTQHCNDLEKIKMTWRLYEDNGRLIFIFHQRPEYASDYQSHACSKLPRPRKKLTRRLYKGHCRLIFTSDMNHNLIWPE